MPLCRYEKMVRPEGLRWSDWHKGPLEPGLGSAWRAVRDPARRAVVGRSISPRSAPVCVLGHADFRFADCGWRKVAHPRLDAFNQKMMERPSVKISVLLTA